MATRLQKANILSSSSLLYLLSLSHARQEPRILPRQHPDRIFLSTKCAFRGPVELVKLFNRTLGDNLYTLHFLLTQSGSIIELFLLLQSQLILPIDDFSADAEGYQVVSPLSGRLSITGSKVLYSILLHDLYAETELL